MNEDGRDDSFGAAILTWRLVAFATTARTTGRDHEQGPDSHCLLRPPTDLLQRAAQVLDKGKDAERYAELLAKIRAPSAASL